MIKLAIIGANGKMGLAILRLAEEKKRDFNVVGLVEKGRVADEWAEKTKLVTHPDEGIDPPFTGDLSSVIDKVDVLIDFTSPEATAQNAHIVAKAGKAYVVGTTGLTGDLRKNFLSSVKGIPVVFSSNMSLSANVMFDLAERVARALPGYDSEIVEIHHNLKKDSPSGTAQTLAESVQRGKGAGTFVYGRHGLVGERKKDEIAVHAVRGGDVVGDHTVLFLGAGERVELVHRVTSRDAFAQGALVAAKWLVQNKKPAGLYDMRDVLGLK